MLGLCMDRMKQDTRAKTALNASQGWINDESGEVRRKLSPLRVCRHPSKDDHVGASTTVPGLIMCGLLRYAQSTEYDGIDVGNLTLRL